MHHPTRREFLASATVAVAATRISATPPVVRFRPGLVTYNVAKDWDLPTILRICVKVGLAAVECRTTHKHGIEPGLSASDRADVKKRFADSGVVFWGCGTVCEFHAADKAVVTKNIDDCKRFIGLVAELGGKGVKVRPNGVAKGMTVEQACEQIGRALIPCGQAAADAGVEIWVEVHGPVTQVPSNMKAIIDVCGHPAVGVTWNSNPTDLTDGKLDDGFKLLAKHIKSCHINDLTNDKAGKYPYRELFNRLAVGGYDRYTLCEVGKAYSPEEGEKFLAEYVKLWKELTTI